MIMNSIVRNGNEVEDLVEAICTKMFFSDFVVRNPTYRRKDGLEKEAADLLVPFKNYLLVFQVKSKIEQKKLSEKTEIEFKRIARIANEAVDQLKTIRRVIDNEWLEKISTVKGFDITFDSSVYAKVIGVVIIDLIGEEQFSKEERTEFISSYLYKYGMPIHILMRSEFDALSTELDTLPDYIGFLDKRQQMLDNNLMLLPVSLLDFLALYKMDPDLVNRALDHNTNLLIEDVMWESYQHDFSKDIARRNELNKPSYLIDAIVDFLHTSVGYNIPFSITKERGFSSQGTIDSYLTIAMELASLPRLERRILGERLLRCMERAENQEQSFSMTMNADDSTAHLVLSMSGKRSKRQSRLYHLCAMAYCYLNLKQIIGVATEPLTTKFRSFDAIGFRNCKFENHEELAKLAKNFFSAPYNPDITEYQGRIDSDS